MKLSSLLKEDLNQRDENDWELSYLVNIYWDFIGSDNCISPLHNDLLGRTNCVCTVAFLESGLQCESEYLLVFDNRLVFNSVSLFSAAKIGTSYEK